MIRYSAIFARRHGEATPYVVLFSFEPNSKAVHDRHQEITDGAMGATFRAEHAEVAVFKENTLFAHHDFPDPALLEQQRKAAAFAEAHKVRAESVAAQYIADRTMQDARDRLAAIRLLTPEQQTMLDEHDARAVEKQRLIDEAQAENLRLALEEKARLEEEQLRLEIEAEERANADTESARLAAEKTALQAGSATAPALALLPPAAFPPA